MPRDPLAWLNESSADGNGRPFAVIAEHQAHRQTVSDVSFQDLRAAVTARLGKSSASLRDVTLADVKAARERPSEDPAARAQLYRELSRPSVSLTSFLGGVPEDIATAWPTPRAEAVTEPPPTLVPPIPPAPVLPEPDPDATAFINRSRDALEQRQAAEDRRFGIGIVPQPHRPPGLWADERAGILKSLYHPTVRDAKRLWHVPRALSIEPRAKRIVDREVAFRLQRGLFNPDEAHVVTYEQDLEGMTPGLRAKVEADWRHRRWQGTSRIDTAALERNIHHELLNGLPMYAPDNAGEQELLYRDMLTVEPKELPAARGLFEKFARFGGEVAPFLAEFALMRKAIGPITRGVARGARLPAIEPAMTSGLAGGLTAAIQEGAAEEEVFGAMAFFGTFGALHSVIPGALGRGAVTGGMFGTSTAMHGGDWQDIAIAAVGVPFLFHMPGMVRWASRTRFRGRGKPLEPDVKWSGWAESHSTVKKLLYRFGRHVGEVVEGGDRFTAEQRVAWEGEIRNVGQALSQHAERAQRQPARYTREEVALLRDFAQHYRADAVWERVDAARPAGAARPAQAVKEAGPPVTPPPTARPAAEAAAVPEVKPIGLYREPALRVAEPAPLPPGAPPAVVRPGAPRPRYIVEPVETGEGFRVVDRSTGEVVQAVANEAVAVTIAQEYDGIEATAGRRAPSAADRAEEPGGIAAAPIAPIAPIPEPEAPVTIRVAPTADVPGFEITRWPNGIHIARFQKVPPPDVQERLKAQGGQYSKRSRGWIVPHFTAEQIRSIVLGEPLALLPQQRAPATMETPPPTEAGGGLTAISPEKARDLLTVEENLDFLVATLAVRGYRYSKGTKNVYLTHPSGDWRYRLQARNVRKERRVEGVRGWTTIAAGGRTLTVKRFAETIRKRLQAIVTGETELAMREQAVATGKDASGQMLTPGELSQLQVEAERMRALEAVPPTREPGAGLPPEPKVPVAQVPGRGVAPPAPAAAGPPVVDKRIPKLRTAATQMQRQIDAKLHSGIAEQRPTQRRARIAAGMEAEGLRLAQIQRYMRAIADAIERGELPEILDPINSKAMLEDLTLYQRGYPGGRLNKYQLQDLIEAAQSGPGSRKLRGDSETARKLLQSIPEGEHAADISSFAEVEALDRLSKHAKAQRAGGPYGREEITRARRWLKAFLRLDAYNAETNRLAPQDELDNLWRVMQTSLEQLPGAGGAEPDVKAIEVAKLERELIGLKIPGFFPTPPAVVDQMIEAAGLEEGQRTLEPSAGKGDLADAVVQIVGTQNLDLYEVSGQLRRLLEAKGYGNILGNFLAEYEAERGPYDRILMNPPFEKTEAIEHIRHAYDQALAPGGRLVALGPEGLFFRQTKVDQAFREWLDSVGAQVTELPERAFESGFRPTGVRARMIVIDKPSGAIPQAPPETAKTPPMLAETATPPATPPAQAREERPARMLAQRMELLRHMAKPTKADVAEVENAVEAAMAERRHLDELAESVSDPALSQVKKDLAEVKRYLNALVTLGHDLQEQVTELGPPPEPTPPPMERPAGKPVKRSKLQTQAEETREPIKQPIQKQAEPTVEIEPAKGEETPSAGGGFIQPSADPIPDAAPLDPARIRKWESKPLPAALERFDKPDLTLEETQRFFTVLMDTRTSAVGQYPVEAGRLSGLTLPKVRALIDRVTQQARDMMVEIPVPGPPHTKFWAFPGKEALVRKLAAKAAEIKIKAVPKARPLTGKPTKKARAKPTGLPKPHDQSPSKRLREMAAASSTDRSRFRLDGVLVLSEEAVVTDGRVIRIQRGDFTAMAGSDGARWYEFVGKDVLPEGIRARGAGTKGWLLGEGDAREWRYPSYAQAIPDAVEVFAIDIARTVQDARMALVLADPNRNWPAALVRNPDDSLGFVTGTLQSGQAEINVQEGGQVIVPVDLKRFMGQLKWHWADGDKQVSVSWDQRAVRTDGAHTTGVLARIIEASGERETEIAQKRVRPGLYASDIERLYGAYIEQFTGAQAIKGDLRPAFRHTESGEVWSRAKAEDHDLDDVPSEHSIGENAVDVAIESGWVDKAGDWVPWNEAWISVARAAPLKEVMQAAHLREGPHVLVDSKFNEETPEDRTALAELVDTMDLAATREAGLKVSDPEARKLMADYERARRRFNDLVRPKDQAYHDWPVGSRTGLSSVQARALRILRLKLAQQDVAKLGISPQKDKGAAAPLREWDPEEMEYLRKLSPDVPAFGMGAMGNIPDLRKWNARLFDHIKARLQNPPHGSIRQRLYETIGRGIYGSRWAMPESTWRRFEKVRGHRRWALLEAESLRTLTRKGVETRLRTAGKPGERKPARQPTRAGYHRQLEDALRGDIPFDKLTAEQQEIFDLFAAPVREVTDYILAHDWTWPYLRAFGLQNVEEVIAIKRSGPGVYLRRLYEAEPQDVLYMAKDHYRRRNVGPRIRGGMYMPRRGDEDFYTVVDATKSPIEYRQYLSEDQARAAWDGLVRANEKQFGQEVFKKVRILDPFSVEELEEGGQLKPIRDVELLMTRTLVDSIANLETLRLFAYLKDTVATDADLPGYVEIANHPAFGPLAGSWVPETVAYAIFETERMRTSLFSRLWGLYNYAFKSSKVVWSPSTWGRNLQGIVAFQFLDRMNPVTDGPWLYRALQQFRNRGPDFERLVKDNEVSVGWSAAELGDLDRIVTDHAGDFPVAVREWIENHPRFAEVATVTAESVSRANRVVGRLYDLPDQIAKLASYLKKRYGLGIGHEEAIRALWPYPNYDRAGTFAKWSRRSPFGAPFVMFTEQAAKIYVRALRDRLTRMMMLFGAVPLITYAARLLTGVTDAEMELLDQDPRRRSSWADRFFQPLLPWRHPQSRKPMWLDLRWTFPLASEFRTTTGKGGLTAPLLFSQPWTTAIYELRLNRDEWTGKDLWATDTPFFAADPRKWADTRVYKATKHVFGQTAPLPPLFWKPGKRGGGLERIHDAFVGNSSQNVYAVILKEIFGITGTEPWIRREDAYALIKSKLGDEDAERFAELLTLYNETYRGDYDRPITPQEIIESIKRDAERDAIRAARAGK